MGAAASIGKQNAPVKMDGKATLSRPYAAAISKAVSIGAREQGRLVALRVVDGAHGVDHEAGPELAGAGDDRAAHRAAPDAPALRQDLRPAPGVDGAVDTLSAEQVRVRRVDNRVRVLIGDVTIDELHGRAVQLDLHRATLRAMSVPPTPGGRRGLAWLDLSGRPGLATPLTRTMAVELRRGSRRLDRHFRGQFDGTCGPQRGFGAALVHGEQPEQGPRRMVHGALVALHLETVSGRTPRSAASSAPV